MDKILDCLGLGNLTSGQNSKGDTINTDPSDSLQDSLAAMDSTSQKDVSLDQHDQSNDQGIMETDSMNDFDNTSETANMESQKSLLKRLGPVIQSEDTRLSFADNNEVILAPTESTEQRPGSSSCPPMGHKNLEEASMDESKDSIVSSQSTSSRKRKSAADCLVIGSAMTTRSKSNDSSGAFIPVNVSFPADKLYEYEWPEGSGQHFMLQEQISEFLGIKSFKRKYPDLERRSVEMEEKQYLKDEGVVSETQCDLGLFAVKTDDIMDLISRDYPAKYTEYMKVLDRRKEANYVASNKVNNKPSYPTGNVEKNKMNDMIKKAIASVTAYNSELNQCRKDERRVSIDLQTYAVHYPIGLGKDNKMLKKNVAAGRCLKVGKYPVATIHGQYQDWYIRYSPEELKYFPLNTVLYGPIMSDSKAGTSNSKNGQSGGEGDDCSSDSDSVSDTGSEDGSSCQQDDGDTHTSNGQNGRRSGDKPGDDGASDCDSCSSSQSSSSDDEDSKSSKPSSSNNHDGKQQQSNDYAVASSLAVCKICKGSSQQNKSNAHEALVHCSDCANSVHPSCLQLTTDMADVIKSYDWQCTDCKTCVHCNKPHNEDKLMFCDICDRGYHTFCVGLRVIPTGKWVCKLCAHCAQCGTNVPGTGTKANWHHETIKIKSPNGETLRRHQLLCINCSKQRKMR